MHKSGMRKMRETENQKRQQKKNQPGELCDCTNLYVFVCACNVHVSRTYEQREQPRPSTVCQCNRKLCRFLFFFFCRDVRDFNFYSRIALPLCMYVFMCDANVFLFSPLLRRADRKMIFG